MSKLYLVRHGQASFMTDDYDRLSEIGAEQGRLLGAYWARRGKRFDAVYLGPLRRHRQTMEAFEAGYGEALPVGTVHDGFIEHSGFQMSRAVLPEMVKSDPQLAVQYNNSDMDRRTNLRVFRHVMMKWAAGEVGHPDFGTWAAFREGVNGALRDVSRAAGRGENVLVFTSGGTIAAAVGHALELTDTKAITLNWIVRNTAYAEFTFREDLFSLTEFNAIPHIEDEKLHTYV